MTSEEWLDTIDPDGAAALRMVCPHCDCALAVAKAAAAFVACPRCRGKVPYPTQLPNLTDLPETVVGRALDERPRMPASLKWLIMLIVALVAVPMVGFGMMVLLFFVSMMMVI